MSVITHWLVSTLHVWRPTLVADGSGGFTESFVDQGAIACKIDQSTAQEREVAAQSGADHSHNVFTEVDSGVKRNDRLAASGVDLNSLVAGDVVYEVESTTTPSSPRYLKCAVERIEVA